MRTSLLELICAAPKVPTATACPVTRVAPKDAKLFDLPNTFIRNIVELREQRFANAQRIFAGNEDGNDNHVWSRALADAHSLDHLIQEYLRCVRDENLTFHYTLYTDWKYQVGGPFAHFV